MDDRNIFPISKIHRLSTILRHCLTRWKNSYFNTRKYTQIAIQLILLRFNIVKVNYYSKSVLNMKCVPLIAVYRDTQKNVFQYCLREKSFAVFLMMFHYLKCVHIYIYHQKSTTRCFQIKQVLGQLHGVYKFYDIKDYKRWLVGGSVWCVAVDYRTHRIRASALPRKAGRGKFLHVIR